MVCVWYVTGNCYIPDISLCLACDSYSDSGWPLMLRVSMANVGGLATLFPLLCHLMGFGVLFPTILFLLYKQYNVMIDMIMFPSIVWIIMKL